MRNLLHAWLCSCAALAASAAGVRSATASFADGSAAGWEISGGAYVSPEYPNAVDRIELSYGSASSQNGEAASLRVAAVDAGTQDSVSVATLGAAASSASFEFPESTDFRRFRLESDGVAPLSFTAFWRDAVLDAPAVASAVALTTSSIELRWAPVDGATGYTVSVWTNVVVGASEGLTQWVETFSGARYAESSTALTDAKFADACDHEGWTRDKVYPAGEDGALRVGNTSTTGWMLSPAIYGVPGDGLAVRVSARLAAASAAARTLGVSVVSGGATNHLGDIALSLETEERCIAIDEWPDGGRLLLTSPASGDRRAVVSGVALLSGYSAGTEERVVLVSADAGDAESFVIDGLPESENVLAGVAARGPRGSTSGAPEGTAVDLSNPPPRAVLNALPLSSLEGLAYSQDYSSLGDGTAWLNGTTLPFWQAFAFTSSATSAVTEVKSSAGASTTKGFYLLESGGVRALGALASQGNGYAWGIAFTNDLGVAVDVERVSFSAGQWGFNNAASQTVALSVRVADCLEEIAAGGEWTADAAWNFTTPETGKEKHDAPYSGDAEMPIVAEPGAEVPPGGVLLLKWTFDNTGMKSGSSAMLGVGGVEVRFAKAAAPLTIRIARAAR